MKDLVIYSHPIFGDFTLEDLINFLYYVYIKSNGKNTNESLKFIIDILNGDII